LLDAAQAVIADLRAGPGTQLEQYLDQVVVVEAATNLANPAWTPVGTNTLIGGSSYFSDSRWTNYPGRFYRVRTP